MDNVPETGTMWGPLSNHAACTRRSPSGPFPKRAAFKSLRVPASQYRLDLAASTRRWHHEPTSLAAASISTVRTSRPCWNSYAPRSSSGGSVRWTWLTSVDGPPAVAYQLLSKILFFEPTNELIPILPDSVARSRPTLAPLNRGPPKTKFPFQPCLVIVHC